MLQLKWRTKGLSGGTVKSYLAVLKFHVSLGDLQIFNMPQLEYVIKGYKKSSVRPAHRCLPITPDILVVLKHFWKLLADQYNAAAFWAASCTVWPENLTVNLI